MRKDIGCLILLQIIGWSLFAQPSNDSCENAIPIGPLVSNSEPTCLLGTTFNANPEDLLNGCSIETEETVWYTILTDSEADFINISVVSDSLTQPVIHLYQGGTCGFFNEVIPCQNGELGYLFLNDIEVTGNRQYFIAVSQLNDLGAQFEICVNSWADNLTCNVADNLIVTNTSKGSPLNGPYLADEEVSFTYTIEQWRADPIGDGNNCTWLQGIVPVFGSGWDPASWDSSGKPLISEGPQSVYGATWDWFEIVTLNFDNPNLRISDQNNDGILEMCSIIEPLCVGEVATRNDRLPGGWFAFIPNQGNSPNTTFGDGSGCDVVLGPWTISFTLKTRSSVDCDPENLSDCTVKMFTFSDAETGSFDGVDNICSTDFPLLKPALLDCCTELDFGDYQLCNRDTFNFSFSDSTNFNWRVLPNVNLIGAFSGSGFEIRQSLLNISDTIQIASYELTSEDINLCRGVDTLFVEVFPDFVVPGISLDACLNDSFQFALNNFNGTGEYDFIWSNESIDSINTAFITSDTIFEVVIIDANIACVDSSFVEISLIADPILRFDVSQEGRNLTINNNSSNSEEVRYDFGDGISSLEDSTTHLYSADGLYMVTAEVFNGCENFDTTFSINIQSEEIVGFNASQRNACAPMSIQFFDSTSVEVSFMEWQFEGGTPSSSTEQNPIVLYQEKGIFDVQLTIAIGNDTSRLSLEDYISINEKPDASFSFIFDDLNIEFINESFNAIDYLWNFGDGNFSSEINPMHTYAQEGVFPVSLMISNECGSDTISQIIDATFLPSAIFELSKDTICIFDTISLINNSTGRFNRYSWVLEGATNFNSTETSPQVSYETAGQFDIRLFVENSFGRDSLFLNNAITVLNKPVADFSFIQEGNTIFFLNESSGVTNNFWIFDNDSTATEFNPIYIIDSTRAYETTLIASNGFCTDTITKVFNFISTSVESLDFESKIDLFPNPNNGSFYLNFSEEIQNNIEVKILSNFGKIVFQKTDIPILNNQAQIHWNSTNNGVFYIFIQTPNRVLAYKKLLVF